MKKVLLLLAALSAISFANEFTSDGKDNPSNTTGSIKANSKVNVKDEMIKFTITISKPGSHEEGADVTFDHGDVQNGKTLTEQNGTGYNQELSTDITVAAETSSPGFSGTIQYGFEGNFGNDNPTDLHVPFGDPTSSNLEAIYKLTANDGNTISEKDKSVEFTLTSTLGINEDSAIKDEDGKVYVPVTGKATITANKTINFKFVRATEGTQY